MRSCRTRCSSDHVLKCLFLQVDFPVDVLGAAYLWTVTYAAPVTLETVPSRRLHAAASALMVPYNAWVSCVTDLLTELSRPCILYLPSPRLRDGSRRRDAGATCHCVSERAGVHSRINKKLGRTC